MRIIRTAAAGTMESSDALITVAPGENGVEIEIQSVVEKQFGAAIQQAVRDTLDALDVRAARVTVSDRGAVDCVLRARTEAAVLRAAKEATLL